MDPLRVLGMLAVATGGTLLLGEAMIGQKLFNENDARNPARTDRSAKPAKTVLQSQGHGLLFILDHGPSALRWQRSKRVPCGCFSHRGWRHGHLAVGVAIASLLRPP